MKIHIISSVCAVLVVFAHFLTLAPQIHAQNIAQLSPIEGLRFDTPIPESYKKKSFSLHFLSSYDMKSSEILTVKKSAPTPINVASATTSSSIADLLVPPVEAEEATESSLLSDEESTASAIIAEISAEDLVETLTVTSPSPVAKEATTTPSPTPKATIKATSKPTEKPVATPAPTAVPTTVPTTPPSPEISNSGGLSADRIFELVNNYRSSKGLPAVQKDERACEVARSRAPEVGAEISGGYMHRGIRQRNLPYFNSEIIISMRSEEEAVKWWINDYIHRVQMEGDYKYSCAACHGNSCVQEFTNFTPKG